MSYNIQIEPRAQGKFLAICRETLVSVISSDPEHDICAAHVKGRYPDGPVQFWRGSMPTLSHSSIAVMAGLRIAMDQDFPYRRVKRRDKPAAFAKNPDAGVTVQPHSEDSGTTVAK